MSENPLNVVKWYENGLNFACTGCGECCTGTPGYVWISEDEILSMAEYLKISLEEFSSKFLRKSYNKWSLKENSSNGDCVFLKGNKCTVYPVRPKQCKTFPWWPQNLESPETWKKAARRCEGITESAECVSFEVIENQLNIQKNEP